MCPVCLATLAHVALGATSTAGVATLIVSTLRGKNNKNKESEMKTSKELSMNTPPIVSSQPWEAARQQLLVKEKALTHARDALAAERRRMPWLAVRKTYGFDGPNGRVDLPSTAGATKRWGARGTISISRR